MDDTLSNDNPIHHTTQKQRRCPTSLCSSQKQPTTSGLQILKIRLRLLCLPIKHKLT